MTNPIPSTPTRAFIAGVFNCRGVYGKGKGGDKERESADYFRAWANRLVYEFPYVARIYDKEAKMEDAESEIGQRFSL